jgi:hypothetical protein
VIAATDVRLFDAFDKPARTRKFLITGEGIEAGEPVSGF